MRLPEVVVGEIDEVVTVEVGSQSEERQWDEAVDERDWRPGRQGESSVRPATDGVGMKLKEILAIFGDEPIHVHGQCECLGIVVVPIGRDENWGAGFGREDDIVGRIADPGVLVELHGNRLNERPLRLTVVDEEAFDGKRIDYDIRYGHGQTGADAGDVAVRGLGRNRGHRQQEVARQPWRRHELEAVELADADAIFARGNGRARG